MIVNRTRMSFAAFMLVLAAAVAALLMWKPVGGKSESRKTSAKPRLTIEGKRNNTADELKITVRDPLYYDGLTIFPISMSQRGSAKYTILEDAIKRGDVEITEINESGSVPELLVNNKGKEKLLIVDGEELVGAKQNRIVNLSLLIAGRSKVLIPVSCVEHGRWSADSKYFAPGKMANSEMRAKKAEKVQENVESYNSYAADQSQVWSEVASLNSDIGASAKASTGAMHDGYKEQEETLVRYYNAIPAPKNANGYIAFIGDTPLAADIFDSNETLRRKWRKLIDSSAIEAIRRGGNAPIADIGDARDFLRDAVSSVGGRYTPPGIGEAWHIDGSSAIGNILTWNGVVLHVTIFPKSGRIVPERGQSPPDFIIR